MVWQKEEVLCLADPKYYLDNNENIAKAVAKSNYSGAYNHWITHGLEHPELNLTTVIPAFTFPAIGDKKPVKISESVSIDYEGALNHWLQTGKDQGLLGSSSG